MSQQFGSPASVIGADGADGETPIINAAGNWQIGAVDTGIQAAGQDGADGANGVDGNTIIDQRTQQSIKVWTGTQVQYDAVTPKDTNTLYVIKP